MKFVWDEPKRIANLEKHGFDFNEAASFDWPGAVVRPAKVNGFAAICFLKLQPVSVIFKPLGREAIVIISMRPVSKTEKKLYDKAKGL
jgi:uncharacterized DUF497 family protein